MSGLSGAHTHDDAGFPVAVGAGAVVIIVAASAIVSAIAAVADTLLIAAICVAVASVPLAIVVVVRHGAAQRLAPVPEQIVAASEYRDAARLCAMPLAREIAAPVHNHLHLHYGTAEP